MGIRETEMKARRGRGNLTVNGASGQAFEQDAKGGEAGSHMDIWERASPKERHVQRPRGRCLSDAVEAQQGGLVSRGEWAGRFSEMRSV